MHPISWEYLGLKEVCYRQTTYGREVQLTCHEDEGGEQFFVTCGSCNLEYLEPYVDLLEQAVRGDGDVPCIPVYNAGGRWTFSVSGALYDYPELGRSRQRRALRRRTRHES